MLLRILHGLAWPTGDLSAWWLLGLFFRGHFSLLRCRIELRLQGRLFSTTRLLAQPQTDSGVAIAIAGSMVMRVAAFAALEAREAEVRRARAAWDHGGHDDAHVQLSPRGYDIGSEVRPVTYEVVPDMPELICCVQDGLLPVRACQVQSVDVVRRIVSAVLRPPEHRDAP